MFERHTERARQVIVLAQDEARALKHNYLGTEHILLGLLREEEGIAARVLESLDITVEEVRAHVVRIVGEGDEIATGQIPFTPRAKKVLELALREALSLGHNYIGTEHHLLGLARENEGVAMRILLDFGADAEKIRNEIIRMVCGRKASTTYTASVTAKSPEPATVFIQNASLTDLMRTVLRSVMISMDVTGEYKKLDGTDFYSHQDYDDAHEALQELVRRAKAADQRAA